MPVENLRSDFAKTGQLIYPYTANSVHCIEGVIEMSAGASATSTYDFGLLPADAYLLWTASSFSHDDLASTGSPTLDIGLFDVDGSLTSLSYSSDDDALRADINVYSAAGSDLRLFTEIANINRPLWQFVSGTTASKPVKGPLRLLVTLKDADCNTGGTLSLEVAYFVK
jgi:hypothetical protein